MKKRERSRQEYLRYTGFFPPNSPDDLYLSELRSHRVGRAVVFPDIKYPDELTEAGLVQDAIFTTNSTALIGWLSDPEISRRYDIETLIDIDLKLRKCRHLLDSNGLPYDRERIVLNTDGSQWLYKSETPVDGYVQEVDPLDAVYSREELLRTPFWYAAKALAHFRRARDIANDAARSFEPIHEFGLAREWMLFGEAWSSLRFMSEQADSALRGVNTLRGAQKGAALRRRRVQPETQKTLQEMARILEEKPALGVSEAARWAHKRGYGPSVDANRKLWNRHKP